MKRNYTQNIDNLPESKIAGDLSEDTPKSKSNSQHFIFEEASEHSITSQYSGKPMSQVIFINLSPSRSRSTSSPDPANRIAATSGVAIQVSPMTSLAESSELADSYDSEAAAMFQHRLPEPEKKESPPPAEEDEFQEFEELESDSITNSSPTESVSSSSKTDDLLDSSR